MTDEKAAWGYVRISQESDASLDEQKRSIREYARANDLSLQTTRNDGIKTSGFDTDRDEYQLLRGKLDAGEIDAVITRDRNRLARDFDERLWLITTFRSTGVGWHVTEVGGRLGLEDVQTAGFECVHAMMDHYKKMVEIERSRQVVQERMEKGYDHGPERFGMTYREDGKYQRPTDDYVTVERVFAMADAGKTPARISRETGVARDTVDRILDKREWYQERAEMHDWHRHGPDGGGSDT